VSDIPAHRLQPGDRGYPRRLAVLGPAAPALHVAGTIRESGQSSLAVAIVGARAAHVDALRTAHALAFHAATRGVTVVSGGAIGVDTAAHVGALDAGGPGPTAVVLGSGLGVLYPERNRALFAAVVDAGGALISMFPRDAQPLPGHFVRRNRIIAALGDVVLVVAAGPASGSLNTARHAIELGRTVAAVAGSPGTDALLAAGAAEVASPDDLDRALAGDPRRRARPPLDADQARAWDALDRSIPRDAGDVARALGVTLPRAASLLSDLEATGWTLAVPGACYVRAP
jgi:DNA processing protein